MDFSPNGFREPPRDELRHYNVPGHAHALTFGCFRRQRFFSKRRTCQWFVEHLGQARLDCEFDLWAYVIMPEHVHLLIWPRNEAYDIARILSAIKLPMARTAIAFVRQKDPAFLKTNMTQRIGRKTEKVRFWQPGGGYDRNLWEAAAVWQTIAYIHQNPVRRGLCKDALEWPWSSAFEYEEPGSGPLTVDFHSLPDRPATR